MVVIADICNLHDGFGWVASRMYNVALWKDGPANLKTTLLVGLAKIGFDVTISQKR